MSWEGDVKGLLVGAKAGKRAYDNTIHRVLYTDFERAHGRPPTVDELEALKAEARGTPSGFTRYWALWLLLGLVLIGLLSG